MKHTLLLAVLTLAMAPSFAMAQCFGDHNKEEIVMSCADGTVYDSETRTCVVSTS